MKTEIEKIGARLVRLATEPVDRFDPNMSLQFDCFGFSRRQVERHRQDLDRWENEGGQYND